MTEFDMTHNPRKPISVLQPDPSSSTLKEFAASAIKASLLKLADEVTNSATVVKKHFIAEMSVSHPKRDLHHNKVKNSLHQNVPEDRLKTFSLGKIVKRLSEKNEHDFETIKLKKFRHSDESSKKCNTVDYAGADCNKSSSKIRISSEFENKNRYISSISKSSNRRHLSKKPESSVLNKTEIQKTNYRSELSNVLPGIAIQHPSYNFLKSFKIPLKKRSTKECNFSKKSHFTNDSLSSKKTSKKQLIRNAEISIESRSPKDKEGISGRNNWKSSATNFSKTKKPVKKINSSHDIEEISDSVQCEITACSDYAEKHVNNRKSGQKLEEKAFNSKCGVEENRNSIQNEITTSSDKSERSLKQRESKQNLEEKSNIPKQNPNKISERYNSKSPATTFDETMKPVKKKNSRHDIGEISNSLQCEIATYSDHAEKPLKKRKSGHEVEEKAFNSKCAGEKNDNFVHKTVTTSSDESERPLKRGESKQNVEEKSIISKQKNNKISKRNTLKCSATSFKKAEKPVEKKHLRHNIEKICNSLQGKITFPDDAKWPLKKTKSGHKIEEKTFNSKYDIEEQKIITTSSYESAMPLRQSELKQNAEEKSNISEQNPNQISKGNNLKSAAISFKKADKPVKQKNSSHSIEEIYNSVQSEMSTYSDNVELKKKKPEQKAQEKALNSKRGIEESHNSIQNKISTGSCKSEGPLQQKESKQSVKEKSSISKQNPNKNLNENHLCLQQAKNISSDSISITNPADLNSNSKSMNTSNGNDSLLSTSPAEPSSNSNPMTNCTKNINIFRENLTRYGADFSNSPIERNSHKIQIKIKSITKPPKINSNSKAANTPIKNVCLLNKKLYRHSKKSGYSSADNFSKIQSASSEKINLSSKSIDCTFKSKNLNRPVKDKSISNNAKSMPIAKPGNQCQKLYVNSKTKPKTTSSSLKFVKDILPEGLTETTNAMVKSLCNTSETLETKTSNNHLTTCSDMLLKEISPESNEKKLKTKQSDETDLLVLPYTEKNPNIGFSDKTLEVEDAVQLNAVVVLERKSESFNVSASLSNDGIYCLHLTDTGDSSIVQNHNQMNKDSQSNESFSQTLRFYEKHIPEKIIELTNNIHQNKYEKNGKTFKNSDNLSISIPDASNELESVLLNNFSKQTNYQQSLKKERRECEILSFSSNMKSTNEGHNEKIEFGKQNLSLEKDQSHDRNELCVISDTTSISETTFQNFNLEFEKKVLNENCLQLLPAVKEGTNVGNSENVILSEDDSGTEAPEKCQMYGNSEHFVMSAPVFKGETRTFSLACSDKAFFNQITTQVSSEKTENKHFEVNTLQCLSYNEKNANDHFEQGTESEKNTVVDEGLIADRTYDNVKHFGSTVLISNDILENILKPEYQHLLQTNVNHILFVTEQNTNAFQCDGPLDSNIDSHNFEELQNETFVCNTDSQTTVEKESVNYNNEHLSDFSPAPVCILKSASSISAEEYERNMSFQTEEEQSVNDNGEKLSELTQTPVSIWKCASSISAEKHELNTKCQTKEETSVNDRDKNLFELSKIKNHVQFVTLSPIDETESNIILQSSDDFHPTPDTIGLDQKIEMKEQECSLLSSGTIPKAEELHIKINEVISLNPMKNRVSVLNCTVKLSEEASKNLEMRSSSSVDLGAKQNEDTYSHHGLVSAPETGLNVEFCVKPERYEMESNHKIVKNMCEMSLNNSLGFSDCHVNQTLSLNLNNHASALKSDVHRNEVIEKKHEMELSSEVNSIIKKNEEADRSCESEPSPEVDLNVKRNERPTKNQEIEPSLDMYSNTKVGAEPDNNHEMNFSSESSLVTKKCVTAEKSPEMESGSEVNSYLMENEGAYRTNKIRSDLEVDSNMKSSVEPDESYEVATSHKITKEYTVRQNVHNSFPVQTQLKSNHQEIVSEITPDSSESIAFPDNDLTLTDGLEGISKTFKLATTLEAFAKSVSNDISDRNPWVFENVMNDLIRLKERNLSKLKENTRFLSRDSSISSYSNSAGNLPKTVSKKNYISDCCSAGFLLDLLSVLSILDLDYQGLNVISNKMEIYDYLHSGTSKRENKNPSLIMPIMQKLNIAEECLKRFGSFQNLSEYILSSKTVNTDLTQNISESPSETVSGCSSLSHFNNKSVPPASIVPAFCIQTYEEKGKLQRDKINYVYLPPYDPISDEEEVTFPPQNSKATSSVSSVEPDSAKHSMKCDSNVTSSSCSSFQHHFNNTTPSQSSVLLPDKSLSPSSSVSNLGLETEKLVSSSNLCSNTSLIIRNDNHTVDGNSAVDLTKKINISKVQDSFVEESINEFCKLQQNYSVSTNKGNVYHPRATYCNTVQTYYPANYNGMANETETMQFHTYPTRTSPLEYGTSHEKFSQMPATSKISPIRRSNVPTALPDITHDLHTTLPTKSNLKSDECNLFQPWTMQRKRDDTTMHYLAKHNTMSKETEFNTNPNKRLKILPPEYVPSRERSSQMPIASESSPVQYSNVPSSLPKNTKDLNVDLIQNTNILAVENVFSSNSINNTRQHSGLLSEQCNLYQSRTTQCNTVESSVHYSAKYKAISKKTGPVSFKTNPSNLKNNPSSYNTSHERYSSHLPSSSENLPLRCSNMRSALPEVAGDLSHHVTTQINNASQASSSLYPFVSIAQDIQASAVKNISSGYPYDVYSNWMLPAYKPHMPSVTNSQDIRPSYPTIAAYSPLHYQRYLAYVMSSPANLHSYWTQT